ncbi:hypothetical protein RHGRI_002635 [Rhododendron griersonianum]|uniref:Uncharacterized protein n=1 Tax=Rhododendron griersonianum TaxID=479676 RepID=A0AAV6LSL8_9ERIC|nr:hypothetical protein RHGRI_002635 [Rhododendron griersonianum]
MPKNSKSKELSGSVSKPANSKQRNDLSLNPEIFEGLRFDFTKGLNQKFSLSHRSLRFPPHYEFGANFIDPKLMLFGRIMTDGRLNARVKCDLSENLILKANAQLSNEPHMSHGMANFDYKGKDYRTQFQLGSLLEPKFSEVLLQHASNLFNMLFPNSNPATANIKWK